MEWMSSFRGTQTIAPNFAFAVGARMLAHSGQLDLSSCQRIGSGSEPIDPATMDTFAEAAGMHALDPRSLYGAYGMAEATVAITVPVPGGGFGVDCVDGSLLEHERFAAPVAIDHPDARRLARVGPPLRGMELRIIDPETGGTCPPRGLGEIEVRGPSVVPGYFRQPEATAATFREDGWLRTGDLGYLVDGELVVCGRLKDMIVVGGRNVFPQDLERVAEAVDGVRKGNVIAFGVAGRRGREAVVVAAEVKSEDVTRVRDEVARAIGDAVGVRPGDVVLVGPGTLPKTSSGKLRRGACRARYLAAELEGV
jgi:fatty-acyl-CoA synthase